MKVKSICIVGGGSSGWMAAASLVKNCPNLSITLVESSDIPTIGVGESTIGSINAYLDDLGLKDEDWMSFCNATYKASIDFTDWDGKGTRVRYPFGNATYLGKYYPIDWFIKKALIGATKNEYADFAMGNAWMLRTNKLVKDSERIPGWNFYNDTAYHMDASLFGEYLKKEYCKPRGVKHVIGSVSSIFKKPDGSIKSISTLEGVEIEADLFVDCTGFASILLGKEMGVPFISFKDKLINDRAVAFRVPYTDKSVEMETSTNATTLSSGWVWNIPLWTRIGTGYVYSSRFLSEEDAEEELREYLTTERVPPIPAGVLDELKPFHVKSNPGIHEKGWVKNVCAVGLSNGFIEPLESTALMLTQDAIAHLINALQGRDEHLINGYDISTFNRRVRRSMQNFSGFVASHFALAERSDSPYWKYVTEELDYTDSAAEEWQYLRWVTDNLGSSSSWGEIGVDSGVPYIVAGMGHNPITKRQVERMYGPNIEEAYTLAEEVKRDIASHKINQLKYMEELPTHYQYLKDNIYES